MIKFNMTELYNMIQFLKYMKDEMNSVQVRILHNGVSVSMIDNLIEKFQDEYDRRYNEEI